MHAWMKTEAERRLWLLPALNFYLEQKAEWSERVPSVEGVLKSFWLREKADAMAAMNSVAGFFLTERLRAALVARLRPSTLSQLIGGADSSGARGGGGAARARLRRLLDPLLGAAIEQTAAHSKHHRDSEEFAAAALALAIQKVRRRLPRTGSSGVEQGEGASGIRMHTHARAEQGEGASGSATHTPARAEPMEGASGTAHTATLEEHAQAAAVRHVADTRACAETPEVSRRCPRSFPEGVDSSGTAHTNALEQRAPRVSALRVADARARVASATSDVSDPSTKRSRVV